MWLFPGEHNLVTGDTYGDGWHGGYWEVKSGLTGETLAGGAEAGQVTRRGSTIKVDVPVPVPGSWTELQKKESAAESNARAFRSAQGGLQRNHPDGFDRGFPYC